MSGNEGLAPKSIKVSEEDNLGVFPVEILLNEYSIGNVKNW